MKEPNTLYSSPMRTIIATTPAGIVWRVHVNWRPRWDALTLRIGGWSKKAKDESEDSNVTNSGRRGNGGMLKDSPGDVWLIQVLFIVLFLVFGVVLWWVLIPLALLIIDGVVLAVLSTGALLARALFKRPWTVEATTDSADATVSHFNIKVVGWRNALRARDGIGDKLRSGFKAPIVDP